MSSPSVKGGNVQRTGLAPKPTRLITYRYVASTNKGQAAKGTVKATSEIEAERLIIARGLNPEHVEAAPSMFSLEEALPSVFKVKDAEVIIFSRQLATLLKSGISLLPALEILQALPRARDAAMFGANLHVTLESPEAIPALEASLRGRGIIPQRVEITVPSLEDVFVSLVAQEVGA